MSLASREGVIIIVGRRGLVGLFVMYISLTAPRVGGSNPRRSSYFRIFEFSNFQILLWPTTHADLYKMEGTSGIR